MPARANTSEMATVCPARSGWRRPVSSIRSGWGGPVLRLAPAATGMVIRGVACPSLVNTTARAAGLLADRSVSGPAVLVSASVISACAVGEPAGGAGMRALMMSTSPPT